MIADKRVVVGVFHLKNQLRVLRDVRFFRKIGVINRFHTITGRIGHIQC